jgi:hypothetical protein
MVAAEACLQSHYPATTLSSGSAITSFSRHVTICSYSLHNWWLDACWYPGCIAVYVWRFFLMGIFMLSFVWSAGWFYTVLRGDWSTWIDVKCFLLRRDPVFKGLTLPEVFITLSSTESIIWNYSEKQTCGCVHHNSVNVSMACRPWPLFQFLNLYTVGRTPWMGNQPVAGPLPTHRTTQTQNKRTQTSMPRLWFEPTIPMFERAKTVHGLDRAATVIDLP